MTDGIRVEHPSSTITRNWDELRATTLEMAERISRRPGVGLMLAKQSVNQALDLQGQTGAVQAAFSLHQLGHAHNREVHGRQIDPAGLRMIRDST